MLVLLQLSPPIEISCSLNYEKQTSDSMFNSTTNGQRRVYNRLERYFKISLKLLINIVVKLFFRRSYVSERDSASRSKKAGTFATIFNFKIMLNYLASYVSARVCFIQNVILILTVSVCMVDNVNWDLCCVSSVCR